MRNIALFLTLLALSVSDIPAIAWAQFDSAPSQIAPVQQSPIGKVVTTKGSVAILHANAVVVQANVGPNGALGQAKVGDEVYQGDTVQTEADGAVGIVFTDGTAFNLYAKSRMVLDEFVYNPNNLEFDAVQCGSGLVHLHHRQGSRNGQHEGEYTSCNDGNSGHLPTCRDLGQWNGEILYPY